MKGSMAVRILTVLLLRLACVSWADFELEWVLQLASHYDILTTAILALRSQISNSTAICSRGRFIAACQQRLQ